MGKDWERLSVLVLCHRVVFRHTKRRGGKGHHTNAPTHAGSLALDGPGVSVLVAILGQNRLNEVIKKGKQMRC